MTTRYALIDRHSGYVFGVEDATSPAAAAIACQATFDGDRDWTSEDLPLGDTTDRGYAAHPVAADWDCHDGQDEAEIATATARPAVAYVHVWEIER